MMELLNNKSFNSNERTIGFYFISKESIDTLSYRRNSKDIFDSLVSGTISCLLISFTIFFFSLIATQSISLLNVLTLAILTIGNLYQLTLFLSRILQPRKGIIIINYKFNKVTFRNNLFRKRTFLINELNKLEYEFHSDTVNFDGYVKIRHWVEVYVRTKNQEEIKIFNYNTRNILDSGNDDIKRELLKDIKPLIKLITSKLKIEYGYNGIVNHE